MSTRLKIILTVFCLVISPYIFLNLFNHPSADDFSYSINVFKNGFWLAQEQMYKLWSGRFLSTILLSANPIVWKWFDGYKVFSLLNQVFLFASIAFLIYQILKLLDLKKYFYFIFLCFLMIYLCNLPSPSQALYWMAGYLNYTLPLCFTMIGLGIYIDFLTTNKSNLTKVTFLSFLIFLIVGCNETIMFQLVLACFLALLFFTFNRHWSAFYHLILFFVCLASSLVVVLAPGNSVRASHFEEKNYFWLLLNNLLSSFVHFFEFLSLPLLMALLFLAFYIANDAELKVKLKPINWNFQITLLCIFLINFTALFPSFISMGRNPARRVDNTFYLLDLFLITILAIQLGMQKPAYFKNYKWLKSKSFFFVFLLSCFLWNNNYVAWADLLFKAAQYDKVLITRYSLMKQSSGQDVQVQILSKEQLPRTIFFEEIKPDSDHSVNKIYSEYFGVKSISVVNEGT